jgi:hypothetical protein
VGDVERRGERGYDAMLGWNVVYVFLYHVKKKMLLHIVSRFLRPICYALSCLVKENWAKLFSTFFFFFLSKKFFFLCFVVK